MDAPAGAVAIELHCAADGPPLRIAAESGRTYHIVADREAVCARLAHEAMRSPGIERVSGSGGLLSGITVLENIVLPAVYHGRVASERLAASVYQVCEACGLDREQTDALCERSLSDLDGYERRLVCLLRALLMHPGALLCERIFEGLPRRDMERVTQFPDCYRRVVANGTLVFLDLAGMPRPEVAADVRVEAV